MNETNQISIVVNGNATEVATNATLAELIDQLDLVGKRFAVELNREIVPKAEHAETSLHAGDVLEIVHAIGGG